MHSSYILKKSGETHVKEAGQRSQSVEFVAKPFTVFAYCCLLMQVIQIQKTELKWHSIQND